MRALVGGFGRFLRAADNSINVVDLTRFRCQVGVDDLADIPEHLSISVGEVVVTVPVRIESIAPFGGDDCGVPLAGGDPDEGGDQTDLQGMRIARRVANVGPGGSSRVGRLEAGAGVTDSGDSSEIRDRRRGGPVKGGGSLGSGSRLLVWRKVGRPEGCQGVGRAVVGLGAGYGPQAARGERLDLGVGGVGGVAVTPPPAGDLSGRRMRLGGGALHAFGSLSSGGATARAGRVACAGSGRRGSVEGDGGEGMGVQRWVGALGVVLKGGGGGWLIGLWAPASEGGAGRLGGERGGGGPRFVWGGLRALWAVAGSGPSGPLLVAGPLLRVQALGRGGEVRCRVGVGAWWGGGCPAQV